MATGQYPLIPAMEELLRMAANGETIPFETTVEFIDSLSSEDAVALAIDMHKILCSRKRKAKRRCDDRRRKYVMRRSWRAALSRALDWSDTLVVGWGWRNEEVHRTQVAYEKAWSAFDTVCMHLEFSRDTVQMLAQTLIDRNEHELAEDLYEEVREMDDDFGWPELEYNVCLDDVPQYRGEHDVRATEGRVVRPGATSEGSEDEASVGTPRTNGTAPTSALAQLSAEFFLTRSLASPLSFYSMHTTQNEETMTPTEYFARMDPELLFDYTTKMFKALTKRLEEAEKLRTHVGPLQDSVELRHWAHLLAVAGAEAGLGDEIIHTSVCQQLAHRMMNCMRLYNAEVAYGLGDKARHCVSRHLRARGYSLEADELHRMLHQQ
ncbi:hypothetical protein DFP72DRAFT_848587 [Ephemerocybe angulata]|uniref:Uncharacterized protein n=1 Tax=Ephemerocybe angulata TaxID=980116 RepID=A0A8H6HVJ7_9AGAR|nr:hypothetical protein DFP72DRAFT_848587 [Tulosesus angulatus]